MKKIIIINVGFDPRYIPIKKQKKVTAWDDKNYFDVVLVKKNKKHKHKK